MAGYTIERVLYAERAGTLTIVRDIGSTVERGAVVATIDGQPVEATITGLVRGMIHNRATVRQGQKIADIDPRLEEHANCFTISDKARAIGGGVLEALLYFTSTS